MKRSLKQNMRESGSFQRRSLSSFNLQYLVMSENIIESDLFLNSLLFISSQVEYVN